MVNWFGLGAVDHMMCVNRSLCGMTGKELRDQIATANRRLTATMDIARAKGREAELMSLPAYKTAYALLNDSRIRNAAQVTGDTIDLPADVEKMGTDMQVAAYDVDTWGYNAERAAAPPPIETPRNIFEWIQQRRRRRSAPVPMPRHVPILLSRFGKNPRHRW